MDFYSQNGEDFLLYELLKHIDNGFFVEVGCIDGRRFSNTLVFEENGWKGICIEAHEDYIDLIKKNRPNSIVCHCAVGEREEEGVTFYANSRGSLSTLNPNMEEEFRSKFPLYFNGFIEKKVDKKTLDSICEYYNIHKIDILSIDIEGYEVEALKGLTIKKYMPKVLLVESSSIEEEELLDSIVLNNGYKKLCYLSNNIFYVHEDFTYSNVLNNRFSFNIIHTAHPLDNLDDSKLKLNLTTNGLGERAFIEEI